MAENIKLVCDSASLSFGSTLGLDEVMGTQKIASSDQEGLVLDRSKRCDNDSFVVEIESLAIGIDKEVTANSRITLQRNLSRKGSQRGERKTTSISTSTGNERDFVATVAAAEASFKGATLVGAGIGSTPQKLGIGLGTTKPNNAEEAQIVTIITTTTTTTTTPTKSRFKRYGGKCSLSWILDPKRILFFFATLSSMGTILLIYFTLSIGRLHGDDISQSQ